jgi:hypothetical protein
MSSYHALEPSQASRIDLELPKDSRRESVGNLFGEVKQDRRLEMVKGNIVRLA